jgi:protein involved in polysaccharide export with SLBB domain
MISRLIQVVVVVLLMAPLSPAEDSSAAVKVGAADSSDFLSRYRRLVHIQTGDQIVITMKEDPEFSFTGEVGASGLVSLPYLGTVLVGGQTAAEAEAVVKRALEQDLYVQATVHVEVRQTSNRYVTFLGAVEKPGKVVYSGVSGPTLLEALTDAGGLSSWGAPDKAFIIRGDEYSDKRQRVNVNIDKAFADLTGPSNIRLQHGDTIFVPSAGAVSVARRATQHVYVYGAVRFPGKRLMPEVGELSIMQAITEAGGLTNWAEPAGSYVLRKDPQTGSREKISVDMSRVLADIDSQVQTTLRAGDVVFVPANEVSAEAVSTEPLEIIVTGQVRNPGLVLFEPGERPTFMRAIFKAGNFTIYAKTKEVRLIRYKEDGTRTTKVINAKEMMDEGRLDQDETLQTGDMIIVEEKKILIGN